MNREEIIKMARDADKHMNSHASGIDMDWDGIERFFHMVCASEREACAKLVEPSKNHRENFNDYLGGEEGVNLLDHLAEAIRERGQA